MFDLLATCAFGLEAVVARELAQLGYESRVQQPGRLQFAGDWQAIAQANLQLRVAERILILVGSFPAADFDTLFEGTKSLAWEDWLPATAALPVRGRSVRSQLTSVPAVQRTVKKAIVHRLQAAHQTSLPETGPSYRIEIALQNDLATLTIDTTGDGLHKRGYRPLTGSAPLRETLAASLVLLSFWQRDRPLLDPFCGTGTIPIEAALIGRNIAPGLRRTFACEAWSQSEPDLWQQLRSAAQAAVRPPLAARIVATDIDRRALELARQNASAAGVDGDIHFERRDFADLRSSHDYGCLICNPPYAERLGDQREVAELYRTFPNILRRLPTWSHFILTAFPHFEQLVSQPADRRRKLYNGRIECQYYQFHGPKPPVSERPPHEQTDPQPVFGGLRLEASRQATEFRNRLVKRAKHLRRWPHRGITCFRLYERDIPEIPLVVDRYEDWLHLAEFERPHDRTPAEHADWLDLMTTTAAEALAIAPDHVFLKRRQRQQGSKQYGKLADVGQRTIVQEGGLKFYVNFTDYLDTGLFLDHRLLRGMVREQAAGRRVLNLFGYTGSFTVYTAAGGAAATTTVDLSRNYLEWAADNMRLNGFAGPEHRYVSADAKNYVRDLHPDVNFDLIVVDPPTFSNSKRTQDDWDVQHDHAWLLERLANHLAGGGLLYFSTNYRRFRLATEAIESLDLREITRQTIPEDFRNKRIHRSWIARCRGHAL